MKTARNAPCPCGSGRKHKLCCGTTRDQELAVARLHDRVETLVDTAAGLATAYPHLRASGDAFWAWAERATSDPDGVTAGEGVEALEPRERRRIERAVARDAPAIWRSFCDEIGDAELVARLVVTGAVCASFDELVAPDPQRLELLEELDELRSDPCAALATVLESGDLWGIHESIRTEADLAALPDELDDEEYERRWEQTIGVAAARLTTRWHRCRSYPTRAARRT